MKIDAIALVGPTACGKTACAIEIAARMPIEIISMDSALVYKGMNIGTAKPSTEELSAAPHHLIDIIDPTQAYSAADFERDAIRLINDIQSRGKVPLIVGGTMLYFKALQDGLDDLPKANASIRSEIETRAEQLGWPTLHSELAKIDPITARRLAPNDAQRISRALEVWRISGKPLSEWFEESTLRRASTKRLHIPLISLEPADRIWLHQRIALRFNIMMKQGFMKEMHELRARKDLTPELPSMRCVGYRQAWQILDKARALGVDERSLYPELMDLGVAATRQLAKRQITWLRSMPHRKIISCDTNSAIEEVMHVIQSMEI
jgi:tRNA dimethylallyltransferase